MLLQEAIKLRILELADERGYSVNKLAERSGIAPSVLKKTVKPYATTKNTSTEIVARICVGLGIPFKTFWDSPLFDNIETRQQKGGCCTRKKSKCSSLFTVKCLQKHKNARHRPPNFQKADNSNRPF